MKTGYPATEDRRNRRHWVSPPVGSDSDHALRSKLLIILNLTTFGRFVWQKSLFCDALSLCGGLKSTSKYTIFLAINHLTHIPSGGIVGSWKRVTSTLRAA